MNRIEITPRNNWEQKIKELGFTWYPEYYDERHCYTFSMNEINSIENATNDLFDKVCKVVQYVIDNELWDEFKIPKLYADLIKWSWNEDMMSFYGRLDLVYNNGNIKLLEFNADTPTSLLEASVIQWYWLKEYETQKGTNFDQFNSIHERLIDHMKVCKNYFNGDKKLYFSALRGYPEDQMTVSYMQDCAVQSGIETTLINVDEISINNQGLFCDTRGRLIQNIFKLYPYELMFKEDFGTKLIDNKELCFWIEPAYKSIMSNKMLLVYLYKLFPDCPYILPASIEDNITGDYVKKPIFSREGANVTIFQGGKITDATSGDYGEEGFIYQQYVQIPEINGNYPVIGSWLIGGVSCGIGVRESSNRITGNKSMFSPHYIIN